MNLNKEQIDSLKKMKFDIIADIGSTLREQHPSDERMDPVNLQNATVMMVEELSVILKNTKRYEC